MTAKDRLVAAQKKVEELGAVLAREEAVAKGLLDARERLVEERANLAQERKTSALPAAQGDRAAKATIDLVEKRATEIDREIATIAIALEQVGPTIDEASAAMQEPALEVFKARAAILASELLDASGQVDKQFAGLLPAFGMREARIVQLERLAAEMGATNISAQLLEAASGLKYWGYIDAAIAAAGLGNNLFPHAAAVPASSVKKLRDNDAEVLRNFLSL